MFCRHVANSLNAGWLSLENESNTMNFDESVEENSLLTWYLLSPYGQATKASTVCHSWVPSAQQGVSDFAESTWTSALITSAENGP
jgi:hypothetical protein